MSLSKHEKTARQVLARYLLTAVDRTAAFSMDMLARLSILEGAAGVSPGTWLRKGAAGFGDALEHFGAHLAASWTTTRNEGVYDKALATATQLLAGNSSIDATDLVQDLIVNSTHSSGPGRSRLFYMVGEKLTSHKNDLGAGEILPRDTRILGTLTRWVTHAALTENEGLRKRKTQPLTEEHLRTLSVDSLDQEKRDALILLALQSPGGPGREIRHILDHLVDQSFPKSARPIIKVFLQKISEPKYRSSSEMRALVIKFKPEKWFSQAVNVVRKEMMDEMGVSPQYLTNVLGSKAQNVIRFMNEKVGRNPAVHRIMEDLAQDIDLFEPGVSRLSSERKHQLTEKQTPASPHAVMVKWLQNKPRSLPPQQQEPQDNILDIFEPNEYMDWNSEVGPHGVHNRGPTVLRVAQRFMLSNLRLQAKPSDDEFSQWAETQTFIHPDSRNDVKFKSLPAEEQTRIRGQWRMRQLRQEQQPGPRQPSKEAPKEAPKAPKPSQKEGPQGQIPREEFFSMPKDQRPPEWTQSSHGNQFFQTADVTDTAKVTDSQISGSVHDEATVGDSKIAGKVEGQASVTRSEVQPNALISGTAQVARSRIESGVRVRGDTELDHVTVTGGSWDGQKIKNGRRGTFRDAHSQEVLDALTSLRRPQGLGDSPLYAMASYFSSGGGTSGWFGLGGKLDRKQLIKKVVEHATKEDDQERPWLGEGASALDEFSDEDFSVIQKAAEEMGRKKKKAAQNRHLVYELKKAALVHPHLRSDLLSLIRLGQDVKVASLRLNFRGTIIRTAYAATDNNLRRVLMQALMITEKTGYHKQADGPRYRQAFNRWITGRKFPHPETGSEVLFVSLPLEEQGHVYAQWQQNRLDWAQRHKPQGLGPTTRITTDNFEHLQPGDVIWRSDSPVMLHKIVEVDRKGWRQNNPVLELIQFNRDNPEQEGERRHLTKSSLRNRMLEYHQVPDMGPRADRSRARTQLPKEPQGGWPKFDNLGISETRMELLQEAFRGFAQNTDPQNFQLSHIRKRLKERLGEESIPRKVLKEFLHQLRVWASNLIEAVQAAGPALERDQKIYRAIKLKLESGIGLLDGEDRTDRVENRQRKQLFTPDLHLAPQLFQHFFDAGSRDQMQAVYAKALLQLANGSLFDEDFSKDLIKKVGDLGVNIVGARRQAVLGLLHSLIKGLSNIDPEDRARLMAAQPQISEQISQVRAQMQVEEQEELDRQHKRQEAPLRHVDRRELRGGGRKQMDFPAKLTAWFIGQVLPIDVSDEIKSEAKEQLKKATYGDLESMRKAAVHIMANWGSDFACNHPLVSHLGYDSEGLKKLNRLLTCKLGDVNGRQYHPDILQLANKYDLESEDADALYEWRANKPSRSRALDDQEKFTRFLAKAKHETHERMKNIPLEDFMAMYKTILKEVLEDVTEASQAA